MDKDKHIPVREVVKSSQSQEVRTLLTIDQEIPSISIAQIENDTEPFDCIVVFEDQIDDFISILKNLKNELSS